MRGGGDGCCCCTLLPPPLLPPVRARFGGGGAGSVASLTPGLPAKNMVMDRWPFTGGLLCFLGAISVEFWFRQAIAHCSISHFPSEVLVMRRVGCLALPQGTDHVQTVPPHGAADWRPCETQAPFLCVD
jgi:hypothetical protein